MRVPRPSGSFSVSSEMEKLPSAVEDQMYLGRPTVTGLVGHPNVISQTNKNMMYYIMGVIYLGLKP